MIELLSSIKKIFLFSSILWSVAFPVFAQDSAFLDLQKRLQSDGFDTAMIDRLYRRPETQFDDRSVSLFFMHTEARLNYDQFLSSDSIQKASRYMKVHEQALQAAETSQGVDKEVITAIILVETRLGTYLGNSSVLNTLSSMAALSDLRIRQQLWERLPADRRIEESRFREKAAQKSKWAYVELKALLTYASQEDMDPSTIQGSYAGALGISQFMPSNILAYAKDGSQDGKIDLFDHADAIMSVASYLKQFGWKKGIDSSGAQAVVYKYNHSNYYVQTVLKVAERLKGS